MRGFQGVLKAAYDFKGRALRRTYWLVLAGWYVAVMLAITIANQLSPNFTSSGPGIFIAALAWSLGAVCVLATSIRRAFRIWKVLLSPEVTLYCNRAQQGEYSRKFNCHRKFVVCCTLRRQPSPPRP